MRLECEICGRLIDPDWDSDYRQTWIDGSDVIMCERCRNQGEDDEELRWRTETGDDCDLR